MLPNFYNYLQDINDSDNDIVHVLRSNYQLVRARAR